MKIKYLENIDKVKNAFLNRFVLSWADYQIKRRQWFEGMTEEPNPITQEWYESSYLWDRMDPDFIRTNMKEALALLRGHHGTVLFMTEQGEDAYYNGRKSIAFIAETEVLELAERIEYEWYHYGERMINGRTEIPDDIYVFDESVTWCIVFTHETWGPNRIDPINGDESRYCIICEYPSSKTTREPYEITEIINEWDPIGLFPAAPDDEYHSEIEQIQLALEMSDDSKQIAEEIWSVFAKSFGTDVFQKTKEECKQIAERLMNRLP